MLTLKCLISSPSDGLIKAVGPAELIAAQYSEASFDKVIDATGMCVLPGEYQLSRGLLSIQLHNIMVSIFKNLLVSGLVDAHTHPVWAGDRVHEFAMKVKMFGPFSLFYFHNCS